MKLFLTLASIIVLSGFTSAAKAQTEIIENAKKFTVLVTNEGLLGGGRGTGVLLDERHVLTCLHMADTPRDEFFVYTYPLGRVYKARLDGYDKANDTAILLLETPATVRVKPVFQTKVQDGEPITVIGNALGAMKWLVTTGVISGRERSFLLTDARINGGNSGGPWINAKGEIVGLTDWDLQSTREGTLGIGGAISAETIAPFMDFYFHPEKLMAKIMGKLFSPGKDK